MKRVLTPLAAACLLACLPIQANAAAYSGMVVFGDSLSDAGQFGIRFTSQDQGGPYFPLGTAGFGNTSPMFINESLGFGSQLPSGAGGSNYAFGGFTTAQINGVATGYIAGTPRVNSETLFYVNGGGNDFLATRRPGGPALTPAYVTNAANNMEASLRALQAAGGRYFLMPLLVDVRSPNVPFDQHTYDMAQLYNAQLIRIMASVDAEVIPLNVSLLYSEVLSNAGAYGFDASLDLLNTCFQSFGLEPAGVVATNCSNATWGDASATPDPSKLIYSDTVHPTTAMQRILADQALSILSAPWEISLLPEMADSSLRASNDALRTQLQADWGDWQQTGVWRGFVSGSGQHRNFDKADTSASGTGHGYSVHLGGSYRLSDTWRVGLAASLQQQELELGAADSDYKLRSYLGTAFAQYHDGLVWFDGNLTAGYLDFHDLDRRFAMGITTRSESGDTDGYVAAIGGRLGVELGVSDDALKISPFISADYSHIQVQGYDESGASSTALSYDRQTRESARLGLGIQARYQFTEATALFGEITREKEFKDDVNEVGMELNSVRGVDFDLKGYTPEDSLTRFTLGAQHQLAPNLALRAGYTYRHQENDNLHGANLSLVMDF